MLKQQKTANPKGAGKIPGLRMFFDNRLKLEFHGSRLRLMPGCWLTANSIRRWG
jgi:hypothetical protein